MRPLPLPDGEQKQNKKMLKDYDACETLTQDMFSFKLDVSWYIKGICDFFHT